MPPPPAEFSSSPTASSFPTATPPPPPSSPQHMKTTPDKVPFKRAQLESQDPPSSQLRTSTAGVNYGRSTHPTTSFQSSNVRPSLPQNGASTAMKPTAVNATKPIQAPTIGVQKPDVVQRMVQPPPPPTRSGPPSVDRETGADKTIAPPSAFGESNLPAHRRREVAAAVAMQWRSASGMRPPSTSSAEKTRSSLSSSMSEWSHDDVQNWLESIQMSKHRPMFQTAGIDGRKLIAMTDDELFDLGVREPGQRLMLGRAIKIALANDWTTLVIKVDRHGLITPMCKHHLAIPEMYGEP